MIIVYMFGILIAGFCFADWLSYKERVAELEAEIERSRLERDRLALASNGQPETRQ